MIKAADTYCGKLIGRKICFPEIAISKTTF